MLRREGESVEETALCCLPTILLLHKLKGMEPEVVSLDSESDGDIDSLCMGPPPMKQQK